MKKVYFLAIAAFSFALSNINAQNVVSGSDMETADASSWTVNNLTSTGGDATLEFGYTADKPSAGTGGCLHVSFAGGNSANYFIYQQVTLKKDVPYVLDMAFKTVVDMDQSWYEITIGGVAPVLGSDYNADLDASISAIDWFKFADWSDCTVNNIDATLQTGSCDNAATDTLIISGGSDATDTTIYFGLKTGGNNGAVEFLMDNFTLTEVATEDTNTTTAINNAKIAALSVYPNPVNNELTISSEVNISSVQVLNVLGQAVNNVQLNGNKLDVAELTRGIYIIRVVDNNNVQYMTKFTKN